MVASSAHECYQCELNNAAPLSILDNPVVIPIRKQLQICISVYFYVNISLILNIFYDTVLSDKKVSWFNLLFQFRPENQSASLPYTAVRSPCRSMGWKVLPSHGVWLIEATFVLASITQAPRGRDADWLCGRIWNKQLIKITCYHVILYYKQIQNWTCTETCHI